MSALPHPVTEYTTVQKSMTNSQSVWAQLNQDVMPIFCDNDVFHLPVNMMLIFYGLVSNAENFHLNEDLLRCAGRYVTRSGVDNVLIEGEVFANKVLL